jgi:DNA-binding CsgD family transcriptional regulator
LIAWRINKKVQKSKKRLAEEKNREIYQQQVRILQLENEKAQFDLRNKSQELSNMLLSEANRKEWNDDILNEIRRIVDCLNNDRIAEAKNKTQQLQNRLARNEETSINWKRFEDNFDIVNNQFITRLSKHYPWISKQERRLCVYIHIGLSSKEIAPLLNISTRAVEMMRYRIRNKMQIDSSISLKQYLHELQSKE